MRDYYLRFFSTPSGLAPNMCIRPFGAIAVPHERIWLIVLMKFSRNWEMIITNVYRGKNIPVILSRPPFR